MNEKQNPHRKMPKAKGDKVDINQFKQDAPAAIEAVRSGSTVAHSIHIKASSNGKIHIQVNRAHENKNGKPQGGIPADIATGLSEFLMSKLGEGKYDIESEHENGPDDNQIWDLIVTPKSGSI